MAAVNSATSSSISNSLWLFRRKSRSRVLNVLFSSVPSRNSSPERPPPPVVGNYTGIQLAETVDLGSEKARVDSWISSRIPGISRARVQSSIRSGLVAVNGRIIDKVSHIIRGGDKVSCMVCELEPLRAEPEEIPLNIVYEDAHVLVVNKPAHMDEHSHGHLAEQFKLHAVHRLYLSLTSGVPSPSSGRIEIPIARDCNNRTRMAAVSGSNRSRNARHAASRYKVVEVFAAGGSALVHWRLETGRTHQIRAHAKYLGIPLLGDELYGGTKGMALSLLKPRTAVSSHALVSEMVSKLDRPCLHAQSLGFNHPHTGEHMCFSCPPPDDFTEILHQLRSVSDHETESQLELDLKYT